MAEVLIARMGAEVLDRLMLDPVARKDYTLLTPNEFAAKYYKRAPRRTYAAVSLHKGVPAPELKFLDTLYSAVTVATGGSATPVSLNLLAQGMTPITRVGMKIQVTSVQIKLRLLMAQSTTSANAALCRFLLVVDKQCNGALPVELELLSQSGNVSAMRNPQNAHRFRTLWDHTFQLNAPGLAWNSSGETSSAMDQTVVFFKRLQTPVYYEGATAALTEVTQNNLVLFVYNNRSPPVVTLSGVVRIRFIDS